MSNSVDARGLVCPQPVLATKRALEAIANGVVTIIVDNGIAKENIVKFATANKCITSINEQAGHFYITITKGGSSASVAQIPEASRLAMSESHVFLITQDILGHGSEELGAMLMKSFFVTMVEKEPLPQAVLFLNGGIKLTVTGSPILDHLHILAHRGVEVLSCGACLDYYHLKDQLAIGTVTNMYTIMDTVTTHKTITV